MCSHLMVRRTRDVKMEEERWGWERDGQEHRVREREKRMESRKGEREGGWVRGEGKRGKMNCRRHVGGGVLHSEQSHYATLASPF